MLFIAYPLELVGCKSLLRRWLEVTGYLAAVRSNGFDAEGFDVD